ncbi:hypothetical protein L3Q82_013479, partial [Scortum barcoo]
MDELEDLSKENFERFRLRLRDRREGPRIRHSAVEGKSPGDLAYYMVSTFTETRALEVALDTLRKIDCNEEAETLYSKTRACVDNGDPTFRKTSTGELEIKSSKEAQSKAAGWRPLRAAQHQGPPVNTSEEAKAKALVLSEGGDPCNDRLVLSRYKIQFGKYEGQTFKWLLENDVGYTAYVVASHQDQREHNKHQNQLMANKDSLTRYAIASPEVLEEIRFHRAYNRSIKAGQEGKVLVGVGAYRWETLQDLYESKDSSKISFVKFLQSMKSKCDPGTKMDTAVKYILKRDNEQAAANRPATRFASRGPIKRPARGKRAQSARGQFTSTS